MRVSFAVHIRRILPIVFWSTSSCSLLFEQAASVDGGEGGVDATIGRADSGLLDIPLERAVSADSEQIVGEDIVDAVDLDLDLNEKGVEAGTGNCVAMEFRNIDIPRGVTIRDASIVFVSQEQRQEDITVNVVVDQNVPVDPLTSASNDIRKRNLGSSISWTPSGWQAEASGPAQTTPPLEAQIQANICNSGWSSGQSLVFVIQPGANSGRRSAYSLEGSVDRTGDNRFAPRLRIRYKSDLFDCP